jgi:hypothetical protein
VKTAVLAALALYALPAYAAPNCIGSGDPACTFRLGCIGDDAESCKWSTGDTIRELAFMALIVADWSQTSWQLKHRGAEKNPFLGERPSQGRLALYMLSTSVIHAGVSIILPRNWRDGWQYVSIGIESHTVYHNWRIGAQFSVPF